MAEENQSTNIIGTTIDQYRQESDQARKSRMEKNEDNFNCYHLDRDYGYKNDGQSREFLPKQAMAVEQLSSTLQQGLVDQGNWFKVDDLPGVKDPKITSEEMQKIQAEQLKKIDFHNVIGDGTKLGALGSLMIFKVFGNFIDKPKFFIKEFDGKDALVKTLTQDWQLRIDLVRQQDYYPDPTGSGLYEIQRIEMDWYTLWEEANKEKNKGVFDLGAIEQLRTGSDELQRQFKSNETSQNITSSNFRRRIVLYDFWGTLLHPATGEVMFRNANAMISSDLRVIMPPRPNPFWHNSSPFVTTPIIRVPHSVWHKALADAGTRLNYAQNDIYNLALDGGIMSVFGVKQVRTHWLDNPEEVSGGIRAGQTLSANQSCPPGQKVLERIDTGAVSNEALQMLGITDREFNQSMLTSDTKLGSLPERNVKATELVSVNQTLNSIFKNVVKNIEEGGITKILEKSWMVIAQNIENLNSNEMVALLGEERARQILSMSKEEVFVDTAQGRRFKSFGLSSVVNKITDFRKLTALLQTISSIPILSQEFQRKNSFSKLLREIIIALDIDVDKINMDDKERAAVAADQKRLQESMNEQAGQGGSPQSNITSQIPQAESSKVEDGNGAARSQVSSFVS